MQYTFPNSLNVIFNTLKNLIMYYSKLAVFSVFFGIFCLPSEEKYSLLEKNMFENTPKELSELVRNNPNVYTSEVLFYGLENAIRFFKPEVVNALFASPEFEVDLKMEIGNKKRGPILKVFYNFLPFFNSVNKKKEMILFTLLNRGADHTIKDVSGKTIIEYLNDYPITTIKEVANVAQKRWNTVGKLLKNNKLPDDLVECFFSFYTDEKNDPFRINKKGYLKSVDS